MTYTVTWTPDEFVKDLRGAVAKGLTAGAIVLQGEMKRNMGSEGGKPIGRSRLVEFTTRSGQQVSFKLKRARTIYEPAPQGHFPGIRTGNLRRSIISTAASADRLIAAAGSAAGKQDRYGLWLEYGTEKMGPRPWIMRSFNRSREKVFDEIASVAKAEFQRQTDRKAVRT